MAKGVNRYINVYINGKQVENNIKSIKSAITKLTNEQKKMTIGSEEYIQATAKIKTLNGILSQHEKEIVDIKTQINNAVGAISTWTTALVHSGKILSTTYKTITSFIKQFTNEYQKMSDVYADVMKYTGLTAEEVLEPLL